MLVAAGIQEDGKRSIHWVSFAFVEHEIHCPAFMKQLVQRDLTRVRIITIDDHTR